MQSKLDKAKLATLAASLVLPLLLASCDRRAVEDDTQPTPAEATVSREAGTPTDSADRDVSVPVVPNASETTAAAPASQADALALLVTLNEHEIAAADQAMAKNVTGKVHDFADMMKIDHARNLTDTTKLGAAASTATAVTTMKEKGEADLKALNGHTGTAYEKAYIDAMVRGHAEALTLFDSTLLPAATDANVRQHFTDTRATIARHLDRAKEIQAALK